MPTRMRALLFMNGFGLIATSMIIGWIWFFALLGNIQLWPLPVNIPIDIPGEDRAWRMAHMEAITQGLLLMGLASAGSYLKLTKGQIQWLFWSAITTAWLFTIPPAFNALFETRGLAFGGGPFKSGLANDLIYIAGWPPMIGVHIMIYLVFYGLWNHLKLKKQY